MKKTHIFLVIIMLFISLNNLTSGQEDIVKLRSYISMRNSQTKLDSLYYFKLSYPASQYLNRANLELFNTYAGLKNTDSALIYADKYLQALPQNNKANGYNSVAFTLANNNMGLDSALVYSSNAVELMQGNPRYLDYVKDTKAFVLYKRGDSKSALELQKEAIKGNDDNPDYLYHLGLYYHANGNTKEALKNLANAVLRGDPGEPLIKFNEFAVSVTKADKDSIVMSAVNNYVSSDPGNELLLKSNAAAFMAQSDVNITTAEQWALSAFNSISKKTKFEDYISFKKNYALVKFKQTKYDEALSQLLEIKNLIDLWVVDYWLTLGNIYEKKNQKDKALDAYATGLAGFDNTILYNAAVKLASAEEIEKIISAKAIEMMKFAADNYKPSKDYAGKVVLAELFTGAECPPCVAADLAFDELSEHYPRSAVAILEYHLHIPGPDPLTNPETNKRYAYYGGDFGTPTAFFEGEEKLVGGGPRTTAPNRFNIYNYSIKKYLDDKPEVNISGDAKLDGDNLVVSIKIKLIEGFNIAKPVLQIAVAEKSVSYTGANGIEKHIFVVRDLVDSAGGTALNLNKPVEITKMVSINSIEAGLNTYLSDPTSDGSWRGGPFTGWRVELNKLNKVNKNNLAVVAWVQDNESKKVIQAYYMDVK